MRRVATALASFALGVACTLAAVRNRVPILPSVSAQLISNAPFMPRVPRLGAAIPTFPPAGVAVNHETEIGGEYVLDGLQVKNSLYAGGGLHLFTVEERTAWSIP